MTNVVQDPQAPESVKAGAVTAAVADKALLVDFSQVIQESLNKTPKPLDQLNTLVRCDQLPHVYASIHDLKRLSDTLVFLILEHPFRRSKLFFYIKCNLVKQEVLPSPNFSWLHFYEICFYTNSCNEITWQSTHERELTECRQICERNSGAFVTASDNGDCLVKITLPGKLF